MKQIKRVLKILAAGLLLGILAICLVYLLPCGSLQKHASESLKILKTEGENPFLLEGYKGSSAGQLYRYINDNSGRISVRRTIL